MEDVRDMVDFEKVEEFRKRALNPEHPVLRGTAQNPDIFFQAREACNPYYDAIPGIVEDYMNKVNEKIGTNYKLFNYYGAPDATHVIVAMGSVCDTIEETIDYLNEKEGTKLGLVKVRLYRPFRADKLVEAIPSTCEQISVLDRTKEPGSEGEPLYLDVVAALKGTQFHDVAIASGRYGLGSKDTTPAQITGCLLECKLDRIHISQALLSVSKTMLQTISLETEGKLDYSSSRHNLLVNSGVLVLTVL